MEPTGSPEDLHTILSRFSHWTGKQPVQATGRKQPLDGVREIPYEEALRQLRNRRAALGYAAAGPALTEEAMKRTGAEAGADTEHEEHGSTDNVQRPARKSPRKSSRPVARADRLQNESLNRPLRHGPGRTDKAVSKSARQDAEFRQALVRSLGAAKQPRARSEDRDLRVSVRLSRREEQELQRRATQAGMTVSAYLRKCALGKDPAEPEATAGHRTGPDSESFGIRQPVEEPAADSGESILDEPLESHAEAAPSGAGWLSRLRQKFLGPTGFESSA